MSTLRYFLLLLPFFTTMHTLQALKFLERQEIAKTILSMKNPISSSQKLFTEDNENACSWFKLHKKPLQLFLQQKIDTDIKVKIMGSMRWKLNHSLSDIDAVIITQSKYYEDIITKLKEYYKTYYENVEQFNTTTKAGLYLFILKNFTDNDLGDMKVEYTIQTPEINQKIINGMQERMDEKFQNNDNLKTSYAIEMMTAVLQNDTKKQLAMKEWTRVLSN